MRIRIRTDKKRKVLSFTFPEVGRNLFFENGRRYLYFPEHEFVFPIRSSRTVLQAVVEKGIQRTQSITMTNPLFFFSHFETYLIFRKEKLVFYPPMTNTNEFGAFCLDHSSYHYDKNMLELSMTCISQYWTRLFYRSDNYYLNNWETISKQDKYDFENFHPLILYPDDGPRDRNEKIAKSIHENRFEEISKEEVSAFKAEHFILAH